MSPEGQEENGGGDVSDSPTLRHHVRFRDEYDREDMDVYGIYIADHSWVFIAEHPGAMQGTPPETSPITGLCLAVHERYIKDIEPLQQRGAYGERGD